MTQRFMSWQYVFTASDKYALESQIYRYLSRRYVFHDIFEA